MRELRQVLAELMPDVTSDTRFFDPGNAKRIEKNAAKLAALSHSLNADAAVDPKAAPIDADLSIPMIAGLFQQETRSAYLAFKRGQKRYAQGVLASVPGFCIGCHTRNAVGPELSADQLAPRPPFLRLIDQARFEASTRQFDKALTTFEKILADPKGVSKAGLDWERAARNAVAIAVRVKDNPIVADRLVDEILAGGKAPGFFQDQARSWKASIDEWKKEGKVRASTEGSLFAEAKRLGAKAYAKQNYPMDRSGALDYLRATRAAHDLLQAYPKGPHSQDALYLLGVGYEALQDMELWSLHELYFEACVRRDPSTEVAQACLRRYEESVYDGFTGSGGTDIPGDVEVKISGLRKLVRAGVDKGGAKDTKAP